MAMSVTLILSTLQRLLAGGLEVGSILTLVLQSLLAVAGGSALTEKGQAFLENSLTRYRIPKHYWQELGAILAVMTLLAILCIYQIYLPELANHWTEKGIQRFEASYIDTAKSSYQQALALRPDFLKPRYYLGCLYDHLEDHKKAIEQYQMVVQSDLGSQTLPDLSKRLELLCAHNNLGRLYILNNNYNQAFSTLERGSSLLD